MTTAVQDATSKLRQMILNGLVSESERITESSAASLLGLSRTPSRVALSQLAHEGLLEKLEGRGYKIKPISPQTLESAVSVRGVLEALAAGKLAKAGPNRNTREAIEKSIEMSAAVVAKDLITDRDIGCYQEANQLFHETIIADCENEFVSGAIEKVRQIPITPGGLSKLGKPSREMLLQLMVGHSQHVIIWDAIRNGEEARAENMMREHANAPLQYARLFHRQSGSGTLPAELAIAI